MTQERKRRYQFGFCFRKGAGIARKAAEEIDVESASRDGLDELADRH
jgi:hypothetical protein